MHETLALCPELFKDGSVSDSPQSTKRWFLRLALLARAPLIDKASSSSIVDEKKSYVLLNAKSVAGRRHLLAGAHNIIRDLGSRKVALLGVEEKSELVVLSEFLPGSMWSKKHGTGTPHEKFFAPVSDDESTINHTNQVVVACLDCTEATSDDEHKALSAQRDAEFAQVLERLGIPTLSFTQDHVPDKEKLQRAYDLSSGELGDVEKAVTMRVSAKDCL